jgi:flagellar biosynthesis protein FlhB
LLAGTADWLLRRNAWQQRQRMTRAEWVEDQKMTYGDPLLRAEHKRLQQESLAD